jgi:2'-5' RNA ligase
MGGMQALELLLGDDTDAVVREEWAALRESGFPSQADHTGETNAPHVTVLAAERLPVGDEELGSALAPLLPIPVRLGPAIAFPGRRVVLARLVVVDSALLRLHEAAVSASRAEPTPLTAQGRWVPHVTLARGIPLDRVGEALTLVRAPGHDGTATLLRHWDSDARRAAALT